MPLYVRDHIAATRHMTLAERGAYADLLFFSWQSGGPLPKDPGRLASLLGCTAREFAALWEALRVKFVEVADGYVSERLEAERSKAAELRRKAAEKAADAARKRWEAVRPDARRNAPSNASGMPRSAGDMLGAMPQAVPGAMLEHCPPSPSPSPSPSPTEKPQDSEATLARKRARPANPDGPPARPHAYATDEERAQSLDVALQRLPGADDETLVRMVSGATVEDVRKARERAGAGYGGRGG